MKLKINKIICKIFGHNYISVGKWKKVCLSCEDIKKSKGKKPTTVGVPKEMMDKYTWR